MATAADWAGTSLYALPKFTRWDARIGALAWIVIGPQARVGFVKLNACSPLGARLKVWLGLTQDIEIDPVAGLEPGLKTCT